MAAKYIISSFIMIAILVVTFLLFQKSRNEWRENSWQKTKCTVIKTSIVKSSSRSPASQMGSVIRYSPQVICRYKAFGDEKESVLTEQSEDAIAFRSRSDALKFAEKYKEGSEHYIYFKTVSPLVCTPKPERTEGPIRMIIAGLLFLLVCHMAFRTFRKISKKIHSSN